MIEELYVNEIIEWLPTENEISQDKRFERILWIGPRIGKVVVIELFNKKALPILRDISELWVSLQEGIAVRTDIQVQKQIFSEDDIPDKHKQIRDNAWNIISTIVYHQNEPEVFDPTYRGPLVTEEKSMVAKKQRYTDI